jgi:hypothetical protein
MKLKPGIKLKSGSKLKEEKKEFPKKIKKINYPKYV